MKPRKTVGIYLAGEGAHIVCLKRTISGHAIQCEGSFSLSAGEISMFIKRAGFSGASACVAVSREQALTLTADLPEAAGENLGETIGFELDRLTPFSSDDALYGYRIVGRDEQRGTIRFYLSVLPKAAFERYRALLEELPLAAVHLEISDSALARAAMQIAPGSCKDAYVISAGRESALVIAASNGEAVCSRVVGLTGEGDGEALEAGLRAMAASIGAGVGGGIGGIGGAGLDKVCFFGRSVEAKQGAGRASSIAVVPAPAEGGTLEPGIRAIVYGAALGAAAGELEAGIDLLREAGFKPRAAASWDAATAALAALAGVLALAVLFTPYIRAQVRYNRAAGELEAMRPSIEKIERIKEKTAALEARKGELARLGGGEHMVLGLLRELAQRLPGDTWLTELAFDGNVVKIGGLSGASSPLISLLEGSHLLEKVEFAGSITMTDGPQGTATTGVRGGRLERFNIKAHLEGSP